MSRRHVVALLALHVFLSAYAAKGHFTDSFLYYWEAESVVETAEFALGNGYERSPSPALKLEGTVEHDGRLYSKYPALYSLVAAPFLALFGEAGLFYLNSLALLGVLVLTVRLTRRLVNEPRSSYLAAAALLGGTYFWYYSQAIWPHMLQTFLILAASFLALPGDEETSPNWLKAGAAGALLGLAIGVRLDTLFAVPAVGVLCLLGSSKLERSTGLLVGMGLPLAALSYVNQVKFGEFTPFTYGTPTSYWEPIVERPTYLAVLLPVLLMCAAFAIRRGGIPAFLPPEWRKGLFYAASAVTVVALLSLGEPLLRGFGIVIVDLRLLEPHVVEPAMFRTDSGAVMYVGHFKKALLQSVPFLPLVLLPLLRPRDDWQVSGRPSFRWLYLIPASYAIVFCGLRWHGGMAFDMRYLLPALPFLAVLAGITLDRLLGEVDGRSVLRSSGGRAALVLLVLLFLAGVLQRYVPLPSREFLFLTLPLILAAVTFVYVGRLWWTDETLSPLSAGLLCVPLFWGGAVSLADFAQQNAFRSVREDVASRFAPHIPSGSLVLGFQKDLLSKTDDVHFASLQDETKSHLPALIDAYLERGSAVFLLHGDRVSALKEIGLEDPSYRLDLVEAYDRRAEAVEGGLFEVDAP